MFICKGGGRLFRIFDRSVRDGRPLGAKDGLGLSGSGEDSLPSVKNSGVSPPVPAITLDTSRYRLPKGLGDTFEIAAQGRILKYDRLHVYYDCCDSTTPAIPNLSVYVRLRCNRNVSELFSRPECLTTFRNKLWLWLWL